VEMVGLRGLSQGPPATDGADHVNRRMTWIGRPTACDQEIEWLATCHVDVMDGLWMDPDSPRNIFVNSPLGAILLARRPAAAAARSLKRWLLFSRTRRRGVLQEERNNWE
jgi:hypothetical protein